MPIPPPPLWETLEWNFEGLEIHKLNIPMDRAQKVDQKNGVIYLVIMVTRRITVIKMSKIISAGSKKPVTVWGKYLSKIFKYSFLHFNTFEIQFLCSVKWTFTCQKSHFKPDNIDILFSEKKLQTFVI